MGLRGAVHALESHHAEGVGPQDLHDGLFICPVADQKIVDLLFVGADLQDLRRRAGGAQLGLHRAGVRAAGADAQTVQDMLRTLRVQVHVQPLPGPQGSLPRRQPGFLALEPGQRLKLPADLPASLLGPVHRTGAQEVRLGDGVALDKQAVRHLGVLFNGRQRGIHIGDILLCGHQAGLAPPEQGRPGRVRQLAVRLTDLHTAQMEHAFQQFLPAAGHRHDAKFFHFYNGHISASQPFRQ